MLNGFRNPLEKSLLTKDYYCDGFTDCSIDTSEIVGGNWELPYLYMISITLGGKPYFYFTYLFFCSKAIIAFEIAFLSPAEMLMFDLYPDELKFFVVWANFLIWNIFLYI